MDATAMAAPSLWDRAREALHGADVSPLTLAELTTDLEAHLSAVERETSAAGTIACDAFVDDDEARQAWQIHAGLLHTRARTSAVLDKVRAALVAAVKAQSRERDGQACEAGRADLSAAVRAVREPA